jgi:sugar/nucleoside kinase (ribokinase family)
MSALRVLTLGETMALLDPLEPGDPRLGSRFTLRLAGAESNFAIALARLGVRVAWVSRLGDDVFGRLIRDALAAEGLDLRWTRVDRSAPTGVFFKARSDGRTSVAYYRRGSAASRLRSGDLPDDALDGIALVHLTGITLALGDTARALVLEAAQRASDRGVIVSFDPNFRPALWAGTADADAAQRDILPFVDWYVCSLEEGCALVDASGPEDLIAAVREAGAGNVVVRIGAEGALVPEDGGLARVPVPRTVSVVDEIGAGDGFAAGFAYGLLQGWRSRACAEAGNLIAAAALAGSGDWETFPRLDEIGDDLSAIAERAG